MTKATSSLKVQPSLHNVLGEWFRPTANRFGMLNEALLPFQMRTTKPLSLDVWRKAYEILSAILHDGIIAHDQQYDLWYCVLEAGLADFDKMPFNKDEASRCADAFGSVFQLMTQHDASQWLSLMFDEIAFVYRGQMPYADKVRERFDLSRIVRLLEKAIINFNVLASCYEHIQQRREGIAKDTLIVTNFSVPAISALFYEQESPEGRKYQESLMERIKHECELQIG